MTTERQVTILSAAAILRGLRASPNMAIILSNLASAIVQNAANEEEKLIAQSRRKLANMIDLLHRSPDLDNLILGNALEGVVRLILPD